MKYFMLRLSSDDDDRIQALYDQFDNDDHCCIAHLFECLDMSLFNGIDCNLSPLIDKSEC